MTAIAKPGENAELLTAAFRLATETHRCQLRKGTSIPYMAHLLGVAELVWTARGTDIEAAGALLHDAVEDGGGERLLDEICQNCGAEVAEIVKGCSDSFADTTAGEEKVDWLTRKQTYAQHLRDASQSILLVSACDKLYNVSATYADYERGGDSIWEISKKTWVEGPGVVLQRAAGHLSGAWRRAGPQSRRAARGPTRPASGAARR